jgi:hypothetical protein
MRATEINVSGPFLKSKIAWKLATYQHALLHRIVVLADGAALAWNGQNSLSAMLITRAFMETIALFWSLRLDAEHFLESQNLGALSDLADHGIFASRDEEWVKLHPEMKAKSVLKFIDRFNKTADGFRGHYDRLSERCHPNSQGHNFFFATLDRSSGTVTYEDERNSKQNAHTIFAGLFVVQLVPNISKTIDKTIEDIAELHHRLVPPTWSTGDTRS